MNWKRPNGMVDDAVYDTSFIISEDYTDEPCPECGVEVEISCDGKSPCPECGAKNVLPCSECRILNDYYDEDDGGSAPGPCDWDKWFGCTPFPKSGNK